MFVYLIVNHATGKIYVGKHGGSNLRKYLRTKLSQAWYELKRGQGHRSYLFASMRKHPKDVWSIHPLISNIQSDEELSHWERTLIKALKTQHPDIGYNICRGGEGFTGPHSSVTRQKIAVAAREMWQCPETRKSIVSKMRGHSVSSKVIQALKARQGTKASPETIEKLRNSHIGLVRSMESREKQSRSVMGARNHFYGKTHSEASMASRWRSVRCIDTDEVFPSLKHVIERFGGNKSNIVRSIKKGHKFFGKRFEYAQ